MVNEYISLKDVIEILYTLPERTHHSILHQILECQFRISIKDTPYVYKLDVLKAILDYALTEDIPLYDAYESVKNYEYDN